jgi:ribosomal protein S18 acetylase RimI-like enzyme
MLVTRPIAASDLDLICRHRASMFGEAGRDDVSLTAMATPFRAWLKPRLDDGRYFGFIVDDGPRPVAGIGLMVIDWPPHPAHPTDDRRGYVLNLYVEPTYRGRGIARQLMDDAETAFTARGITHLVLHATEMARPIYQRLGWQNTSELAKSLQ